ncbi:MAG: hypothetical protein IKF97_06910 [Clostridia bacterium]|nr:hypothetical protein [Clostridia bacterium]
MNKFFKFLSTLLFITIIGVGIYFIYDYFMTNNFNDYTRSALIQNSSEFTRDKNIQYSSERSFKIYSPEYNDAMISKEISVKKNTPYRLTCMVKTENVESENNKSGSGAHLSVDGTTTRSIAVTGTKDWQKIELLFNSKNEDKVKIGYRLGGYIDKCKGTAWFSDMKVEEGVQDTSNEWKFACFIYNTTNVTINNKNINLTVTDSDIRDIKDTITRFENSCNALSKNKMTAETDIYAIDKPLTKLSYDEEFGYFVAPEDVEKDIKATINKNNYDHIFIVIRLGDDIYKDDIQVNDWIGLGSMDYYGIGFSNIRLPNDSRSYIYRYDSRVNLFPEEVFLHEFLHSLERNAKEYGFERPALHDYEKYGYSIEQLIGQKRWYTDYMNKEINFNGSYIGLPEEIYTLKPAKQQDFENSVELVNIF